LPSFAAFDAGLVNTQCLSKALLFRARTGHFPKSLSEIPGAWIDPYNGKPLGYKTSGDSIRIYSVGYDLHDDGGISRLEIPKNSKRTFDLVAAYPKILRSGKS